MRKHLPAALALALCIIAAAAALGPGISAWFVADDFHHLAFISLVPHPWHSWTHAQFGPLLFRPVPYTLSFYLDGLLGLDPARMHLAGLVIHCLNTALVFFFVRLLLRPKPGEGVEAPGPSLAPAFLAALLFSVHPVSVLTANWFACRADIIGFFFAVFSLAVVAGHDRPRATSLLASGVLGLLALLSKVTFAPLFIAGFLVSFARNSRLGFVERWRRAVRSSLPLFLGLLVYVSWRLLVLGRLGGYEPLPGSAGAFFEQARHHLPRVGEAAAGKFLLHQMSREHALWGFLVVSWAGMALVCGPAALWRRRAELMLGLLLIGAGLIPVWNLSHMLAFRGERLLIFPLLGFLIVIGSLVSGPRDKTLRAMSLMFALLAGSLFGVQSRDQVRDWRQNAQANQQLSNSLSEFMVQDLDKQGERIYVIGLSSEHYYLDMMVKWSLPPSLWNREIMLGDQDSFIFMAKRLYQSRASGRSRDDGPDDNTVAGARFVLPERQRHASDPALVLETVSPPDLLTAAAFDPAARVIEFKNNRLRDITPELKSLFENERVPLRSMAINQPELLPSFSFVRTRVPFDWELSSGLELIAPREPGRPWAFIAHDHDPHLISPEFQLPALMVGEMFIELRVEEKKYLPPAEQNACLSWATAAEPEFRPPRKVCFPIKADGRVHAYRVNLMRNIHWARGGLVTRLRLDPIAFPGRFEILTLEFRGL